MKQVLAHTQGTVDERSWATQWAGLDPAVFAQFPAPAIDWPNRVRNVIWIAALTWTDILTRITAAAGAAGSGGVVVLATGHGGSDCMKQDQPVPGCDPEVGIVNFDATEPPGTVRSWNATQVGKGLFFNHEITRGYNDPRPFASPPTLKAEDEEAVVRTRSAGWQWKQKRLEAFDAFIKIGLALQANHVARFTFTVCSAGSSTAFIDRISRQWKAEVACFRFRTAVFNDGQKARLCLARDLATLGQGTNVPIMRAASPSLDDRMIAYVGHP